MCLSGKYKYTRSRSRYIIMGEPKKETDRIPGPDISRLWDYFLVNLEDKFSLVTSVLPCYMHTMRMAMVDTIHNPRHRRKKPKIIALYIQPLLNFVSIQPFLSHEQ